MKISEQWLRTFVNPDLTSYELAESLTMAGLEVEGIIPAALDFSDVIVGEVLEVAPHPDADRLRVCSVNINADQPLNIVCGAKNVCAGLKVAVAIVGAILPENFKIKKAKLRGVESYGMICSVAELGLAKSSPGIMELPQDAPVGQSVREYLELDDQVFEIGLTPNRGDCLSILGMARDVKAITKCKFNPPAIKDIVTDTNETLPIQVSAKAACPHYVGRIVQGINPKAQTPVWIQERLRRSGINTISPIVDVTNYVMLELGQPLHAFDLAKLKGEIQVRYAKPQEKLTLLDNHELILDEQTLVIADKEKAKALAGVMGGLDSGVTDATQDIFLESAFFDSVIITNCARRFGLHTDSSYRFERGVDPELQIKALQRTTELLLSIAGGQPGPVSEFTDKKYLPKTPIIKLRRDRIKRILGIAIPDKNVISILQNLGMKAKTITIGWEVLVPSFRFDIALEIDLIEELARIHGYDKVPVHKPLAELAIKPSSETKLSLRRVRSLLVDRGYREIITYSFVDPKIQNLLDPEHKSITLNNPISEEMSVMRTNIWPGLIKTVLYNQNRQQSRMRFFETGLCFTKDGKTLRQHPMLGGVVIGGAYPEQWGMPQPDADFFDVKGDLEALLQLTGHYKDINFKAEKHPSLHPVRCARIYCAEKPIGYLGELHPKIKQELEIIGNAFLFELDLSLLQDAVITKFEEISRFPAVHRDIAVIVDEAVSAQQLLNVITAKGGALLQKVQVFDIYQGESIEKGKKSVALSLILQHASRTLVDAEVENVMQQILQKLKSEFNITLRG